MIAQWYRQLHSQSSLFQTVWFLAGCLRWKSYKGGLSQAFVSSSFIPFGSQREKSFPKNWMHSIFLHKFPLGESALVSYWEVLDVMTRRDSEFSINVLFANSSPKIWISIRKSEHLGWRSAIVEAKNLGKHCGAEVVTGWCEDCIKMLAFQVSRTHLSLTSMVLRVS